MMRAYVWYFSTNGVYVLTKDQPENYVGRVVPINISECEFVQLKKDIETGKQAYHKIMQLWQENK